jgi:hypothetical protein
MNLCRSLYCITLLSCYICVSIEILLHFQICRIQGRICVLVEPIFVFSILKPSNDASTILTFSHGCFTENACHDVSKPILNRALIEAIRNKGGPGLTDSFSD